MKTRENELHEPKITPYKEGLWHFAIASCSVCEEQLISGILCTTEDGAIKDVHELMFNYCPNCGAKLKEVAG